MGIATLAIETEKTNFKDLTHQLNNYNELFNLNAYMASQNNTEGNRLAKTNETLKSQVLRMKQLFLSNDYQQHLYRMKTNIVLGTVIAFAIMFVIVGLHMKKTVFSRSATPVVSRNTMFIGVSVAAIVYFMFVIAMVRRNAQRRKLNWGQFYWQNMSETV